MSIQRVILGDSCRQDGRTEWVWRSQGYQHRCHVARTMMCSAAPAVGGRLAHTQSLPTVERTMIQLQYDTLKYLFKMVLIPF